MFNGTSLITIVVLILLINIANAYYYHGLVRRSHIPAPQPALVSSVTPNNNHNNHHIRHHQQIDNSNHHDRVELRHRHRQRLAKRMESPFARTDPSLFTTFDDLPKRSTVGVISYDDAERATLANLKLVLTPHTPRHNPGIYFSRNGRRVKIFDNLCAIDSLEQHRDYQLASAHFISDASVRFNMLYFKRDYSDNRNYEKFQRYREKLMTDHYSHYLGYIVDAVNHRYVVFMREI